MLNGFNFSNLLYANNYYGNSGWFTASYSNGTNDTLWGYGFTYDIYGYPTGAGTVTGYSFFGNWSADLLINISGISVPASWIRDAAMTPSTPMTLPSSGQPWPAPTPFMAATIPTCWTASMATTRSTATQATTRSTATQATTPSTAEPAVTRWPEVPAPTGSCRSDRALCCRGRRWHPGLQSGQQRDIQSGRRRHLRVLGITIGGQRTTGR